MRVALTENCAASRAGLHPLRDIEQDIDISAAQAVVGARAEQPELGIVAEIPVAQRFDEMQLFRSNAHAYLFYRQSQKHCDELMAIIDNQFIDKLHIDIHVVMHNPVTESNG